MANTSDEPDDHPTSMLPEDPRRQLLERVRAEIVAAAKHSEWSASKGGQTVSLPTATLDAWVNRLTEAIHFNGRVPEIISGIRDPESGLKDLDNGMNRLTYIATSESLAAAATQAKLSFNQLHRFRHHLQDRVTKMISHLDNAKSAWNVFDEGSARSAVRCARAIAADFLGLQ